MTRRFGLETLRARPALVVAAAITLLAAGAFLPLWSMTLRAPQYPQGLRLIVDGGGARGDVSELNALNHYIGMPPLPGAGVDDDRGESGHGESGHVDALPELALFYPGVAALALAIALVPVVRRRWFSALAALGAWALPLGFLADLQWRLYSFGHSLNPEAPFRPPPFTPKVLGPTTVMNFDVIALPGPGLLLFVLSALLLTAWVMAGPRGMVRRRYAAAAAAIGVLLASGAGFAPTALAHDPHVDTPAPGAAFNLAAAIAAAAPGAVIDVPPGRYNGPITLAKRVTLRGKNFPVIDGGRHGNVIVITGHDVRVEGFQITRSALAYSSEAAGIVVQGDRAVIRNNVVTDVLFGIYLAGASGTIVEDNAIATADLSLERRGHAVYLWKATGVTLRGNRITRGKDGFYISFSDGNLVEGNTVTGCRYGIHYMYSNRNTFRSNVFRDNAVGGAVMNSADVTLAGNTFEGSRSVETGVGLLFKDADRVLVRENRIARNRIALEFENAPIAPDGWVRVERNLIAFNEVGFSLMSTAAVTVIENAVVENLRPVAARGAVRPDANRWTVGGRGNYWSDYTGFDLAGDGVGDVPYRRADLLEDLILRAPALQAFLFTPAHHAVEAATRLVPILAAPAIVHDAAPLVRPPATDAHRLPAPAADAGGWTLWRVGVLLLAPGALGLAAARPRRIRP